MTPSTPVADTTRTRAPKPRLAERLARAACVVAVAAAVVAALVTVAHAALYVRLRLGHPELVDDPAARHLFAFHSRGAGNAAMVGMVMPPFVMGAWVALLLVRGTFRRWGALFALVPVAAPVLIGAGFFVTFVASAFSEDPIPGAARSFWHNLIFAINSSAMLTATSYAFVGLLAFAAWLVVTVVTRPRT